MTRKRAPRGLFGKSPDRSDIILGKSGIPILYSPAIILDHDLSAENLKRVPEIFTSGNSLKVFQSVVMPDSVFVVDLMINWNWADKRLVYQAVHFGIMGFHFSTTEPLSVGKDLIPIRI